MRSGVIVARADTLEEAAKLRKVSADLVIDAKTHRLVEDTTWMWDWEIKAKTSYVNRALADRRAIVVAMG